MNQVKKSAAAKTPGRIGRPRAEEPRRMAGIRMTDRERDLIDEAAYLVRRSRTEFVMLYALEAADKVLAKTPS